MFTIRGLIEGREGEVEVSWLPVGAERYRARPKNRRGLVGDDELIRRAMLDEAERRTFRATPTGPCFGADLDDTRAALVQLCSYFRPGYRLDGTPPAIEAPIPPGAFA